MTGFYSEELINEVWEKGQRVYGYNENLYRKDEFGSWILRTAYGNRTNNMGWEIGYVSADDGGDSPENLQPLQWENWDMQQEALI